MRTDASQHSVEEPLDLFETELARSMLDQLLSESRLYTKSKDYRDLLDFVVRLRNFAPFNAMLLHIQKPGLSYAASAPDWRERFERRPKEGARPLLILWPFGPVAFVFDVLDTEGKELPVDVASFFAKGTIGEEQIWSFVSLVERKGIEWVWIDAGDRSAGAIRVVRRAQAGKEYTHYRMEVNRNHSPAVQFATLAHELGHLFLGHLGPDSALKIPSRLGIDYDRREIEAESVAYLVCARSGVTSKSESYLAKFVGQNSSTDSLDLYQVMRAAGQVEALLGLTSHTKFDKPGLPIDVRQEGGEMALSEETQKLREERKELSRRLNNPTPEEQREADEAADELASLFPEFIRPVEKK